MRKRAAPDLAVLANPTRLALFTSLRLDGPGTAKELSARLGLDELGLYYHLRKLQGAGVTHAESRPAATKPESVFYAPKERIRINGKDLDDAENREALCKTVDAFLKATSKEHRLAVEVLHNAVCDRSAIGRLAVRLGADKISEFLDRLKELQAWLDENATPEGDRYIFTCLVTPLLFGDPGPSA